MDFGLGSLIEKLEEYLGRTVTRMLLILLAIFAFMWLCRGIVEGAVWMYDGAKVGGQHVGLWTVEHWVAFSSTALVGFCVIFLVFVVLLRLTLGRRLNLFEKKVKANTSEYEVVREAIEACPEEVRDEISRQYEIAKKNRETSKP